MWSFQRYAKWLDNRTSWSLPGQIAEVPDTEPAEAAASTAPPPQMSLAPKAAQKSAGFTPDLATKESSRIEIEPVEGGLGKILKKLE